MRHMQENSPKQRELVYDEADARHREELLDEALEETFPASDPVSLTVP
jgi:hypothetical protein